MSQLMSAVCTMKKVFDQYAGKDGDPTTLSKKELGDLLRAELGFEEVSGKDIVLFEVNKFFAALDHDKSGTVDCTEYCTFVCTLAILMMDTKGGKGKC
uniref:EF-hand domain-containing protein n=1 Tax=Monopterus albus TaxID=43700 RepID=A0A3Q3KJ61_MONAL